MVVLIFSTEQVLLGMKTFWKNWCWFFASLTVSPSLPWTPSAFSFHSFPWQESHSSVGTITVPLKHLLCLHYSEKDLRAFNASQESDHAFRWKAFSKVLFYTDATVNLHSESNICSTGLKGTGTLLLQQWVLQKPSRHKFPWVSFLNFSLDLLSITSPQQPHPKSCHLRQVQVSVAQQTVILHMQEPHHTQQQHLPLSNTREKISVAGTLLL